MHCCAKVGDVIGNHNEVNGESTTAISDRGREAEEEAELEEGRVGPEQMLVPPREDGKPI